MDRSKMKLPAYLLAALILLPANCRGETEVDGDDSSISSHLRLPLSSLASAAGSSDSYLAVQDDRLVDGQGRQVLLHGLNVISKSKAENYLSWHRAEEFAAMQSWGMNCIRLGILWDALEPTPGQYDEDYLKRVEQRVDRAAQHGLLVILDMHQDLFSSRYGDGAPNWATINGDAPHKTGAVWSDSYLISPAVQLAFDSFWSNAPAADGVGIQDHYAAAWAHVAKRFAGNKTIVGYDLMNEPFEGTSVMAAQIAWLTSDWANMLVERLGDKISSPVQIPILWLDPAGRAAIMHELEDVKLYEAFLEAQRNGSQAFERDRLQPMYQRVADAIRTVDTRHILLLEPSCLCNSGVRSGIEPVKDANGRRDPQQAYAPHAYDIVVDTPALKDANSQRLQLIFAHHGETASRLDMPMILGEWGAFGNADKLVLPTARFVQQQIELLKCSDVYWEYYKKLQDRDYLPALVRSVPCRVAGELSSYSTNPQTGEFHCRWKESSDATSPSVFYLNATTAQEGSVHLTPPGKGFKLYAASQDSRGVYLSIPPTGQSAERILTVQ